MEAVDGARCYGEVLVAPFFEMEGIGREGCTRWDEHAGVDGRGLVPGGATW